jgi:hypothetical protein
MMLETRSELGLARPLSRPRIGAARGVAAHYNGPAMRMQGQPHSVCQARWRGIQRFHMGRNHPQPMANGNHWQDIAYTAGVCHHEIVMEGRGKNVRTAANGTNAGNNEFYAIFFMVGGDEVPSQAMLRAADWYRTRHLGVALWRKHADFKATSCAGMVNDFVRNGSLQITIADTPGPQEDDVFAVRFGQNDPYVRRAQVVMNAAAKKAGLNIQLVIDGQYGPKTADAVDAFARRAGMPQEGQTGMHVLVLDYCRNWLAA